MKQERYHLTLLVFVTALAATGWWSFAGMVPDKPAFPETVLRMNCSRKCSGNHDPLPGVPANISNELPGTFALLSLSRRNDDFLRNFRPRFYAAAAIPVEIINPVFFCCGVPESPYSSSSFQNFLQKSITPRAGPFPA